MARPAGSEAAAWEGLAHHFWSHSGPSLQGRTAAEALGGKDLLKGEGPEGSGLLCSLLWRRAFPVEA